jgi:hypothetical protein
MEISHKLFPAKTSIMQFLFVFLYILFFLSFSLGAQQLRRRLETRPVSNITAIALTPARSHSSIATAALIPSQSVTVTLLQTGFSTNCYSGGACILVTSSCQYGSTCYFDLRLTAGKAWSVQANSFQVYGTSSYQMNWGTTAAQIGYYAVGTSYVVDNCKSEDKDLYLRVHCTEPQCQVQFNFDFRWGCGLQWVAQSGYTSCDSNCRKSKTVQCYITSPSYLAVDNSVCQAALGAYQSETYSCVNGESCGSNYGTCSSSNVCTPPPTQKPTGSPSLKPTVFIPNFFSCVSDHTPGNDFNAYCESNKCLPGVQDILGFGYDITLSNGKHFAYDFAALRYPVYSFKAPFAQYRFNGELYYKPSPSQVDASTESETKI